MLKIKIKYFAHLKELAQKNEEDLEIIESDPALIYAQLKKTYQFQFEPKHLKIAVNNEFVSWDYQLKNNDELVFIPPVAGG